MRVRSNVVLMTAVGVLVGAAGLHANIGNFEQQRLAEQARVMEQAVTNSSVTELHSASQRAYKLELIEAAREQLQAGQLEMAAQQLDEAARRLYPMAEYEGIPLPSERQQQWLSQMERAIDSILPVARDIAGDKQAQIDMLTVSENLYQQAQAQKRQGRYDMAEALLQQAYAEMKRAVVMLRSGDLLVIEQPQSGTEQAWQEAVRRYQDWRYFADWMEQNYTELGVDPNLIAKGSDMADKLFQQARAQAQEGGWGEATARIDRAYLLLEGYWRKAGVNI